VNESPACMRESREVVEKLLELRAAIESVASSSELLPAEVLRLFIVFSKAEILAATASLPVSPVVLGRHLQPQRQMEPAFSPGDNDSDGSALLCSEGEDVWPDHRLPIRSAHKRIAIPQVHQDAVCEMVGTSSLAASAYATPGGAMDSGMVVFGTCQVPDAATTPSEAVWGSCVIS
jgi:hypothetical protein